MASDRKTFAAEDSGLGSVVGDWLDPFASDDTAAIARSQVDADDGIPFSEWCVIPVALAIVVGDMIYQFMR
jgi:hypothetical protein